MLTLPKRRDPDIIPEGINLNAFSPFAFCNFLSAFVIHSTHPSSRRKMLNDTMLIQKFLDWQDIGLWFFYGGINWLSNNNDSRIYPPYSILLRSQVLMSFFGEIQLILPIFRYFAVLYPTTAVHVSHYGKSSKFSLKLLLTKCCKFMVYIISNRQPHEHDMQHV